MNIKQLLNHQVDGPTYASLYSLRDNSSLIQKFNLAKRLQVHRGCVNTICWSDDDPRIILSGSDDQCLSITDAFSGHNKLKIQTGHRTNIFSAKFLPQTNSERVISCSSGGDIYLTDTNASTLDNASNHYECHGDRPCYELRTFAQDPSIFVSCGQDGTCKWIDTRLASKCSQSSCQEHTLVKIMTGITAIALNPVVPYHLACAGLDGVLRLYDRRMLSVGAVDDSTFRSMAEQSVRGLFACFSPPIPDSSNHMINHHHMAAAEIPNPTSPPFSNNKRITSVQYDRRGEYLLASYHTNKIYLLDWKDLKENSVASQEETNVSQAAELEPVTADLLPPGVGSESNSGSQQQQRKFRIQTDWSDTGPNSVSMNEMENSDPRTYLARRLNDWFNNLTQARANNRAATQNDEGRRNRENVESNDNEERISMGTGVNNPRITESPSSSSSSSRQSSSRSSSGGGGGEEQKRSSSAGVVLNKTREHDDIDDERVESEDERGEDVERSTSSQSAEHRKRQMAAVANTVMNTRIRSKQASRIESSLLKTKPAPNIVTTYSGHRNARTIIKEAGFWGNDHIVSGSDCGHVFCWNKHTAKIVNVLEADKHVVNCVQENSLYPVLASSGIDYDVKIWEPTLEFPLESLDAKIEKVTRRNRLMLEENRNTIFIPVQFMLPALRLFGANMHRNNRANTSNNSNSNTTANNDLGQNNNNNSSNDNNSS